MAKVKKSTVKLQGKASKVSQPSDLKSANDITAERNGKEQTFSAMTWDLLPPGKLGWSEKVEKPSEINTENTNENKGGEGEKENGGGGTERDTVDHEVTQEDLDTNPTLAESGVKVGEIIQIQKTEGGVQ